MQCLLDSDVIWKLATFDLLNELLTVLGANKTDLYCLPELEYQLKSVRFLEKQSRDAVQRVTAFIKGMKRFEKIDRDEQIILHSAKATYQNRVEYIDGGEQLLFIATRTIRASIISTHDKKSLRTLANDASCRAIFQRVKGRVLCLEQIVLRMIDRFGYQHVHSRIAPTCIIDDVMREAFANGRSIEDHSESDCRQWLVDHIKRLNDATSNILADG